jgi:hypothetical protein
MQIRVSGCQHRGCCNGDEAKHASIERIAAEFFVCLEEIRRQALKEATSLIFVITCGERLKLFQGFVA